MAAYAFPKSARLVRHSDYVAIRRAGSGFVDGPLAASFRPRGPTATRAGIPTAVARVGLTVSSKVGGAVERNRIKRRLREAIRLELSLLPAVDLVLVARASACDASVDDFRHWLRSAAARMRKVAS